MSIASLIDKAYERTLSEKVKRKGEQSILGIAIGSYLLHLLLILLSNYELIDHDSHFLSDPIAAIYTPFSFILIYEVYLLVFFLPKSLSYYIGKQYEIITLIVIRRIFKDIAKIELDSHWFEIQSDLQFTFDCLTSLILFILIFLFYRNIRKRDKAEEVDMDSNQTKIKRFIRLKKVISTLLVPAIAGLAIYSFGTWAVVAYSDYLDGIVAFKHINNIFFDEFFTVLIIVDVLMLLASFFYSDHFHKIIRNSGFVISTILIKLSFANSGLINNALIIGAVLFGFLILVIHNLYEKQDLQNKV